MEMLLLSGLHLFMIITFILLICHFYSIYISCSKPSSGQCGNSAIVKINISP